MTQLKDRKSAVEEIKKHFDFDYFWRNPQDIQNLDQPLRDAVELWYLEFLFDPENIGPSAPWEPGQFNPEKSAHKMPSKVWKVRPLPWTSQGRGNGHVDYIDNNGKFVLHVYFWDRKNEKIFNEMYERITEDFEKETGKTVYHNMNPKKVSEAGRRVDTEIAETCRRLFNSLSQLEDKDPKKTKEWSELEKKVLKMEKIRKVTQAPNFLKKLVKTLKESKKED